MILPISELLWDADSFSPVIDESLKQNSTWKHINVLISQITCHELFGVAISFLFCLYRNWYNDVFIHYWEFWVLLQADKWLKYIV